MTRCVSEAARLLERSKRETSLDKYSKSKKIHELAAHTSSRSPAAPSQRGKEKGGSEEGCGGHRALTGALGQSRFRVQPRWSGAKSMSHR